MCCDFDEDTSNTKYINWVGYQNLVNNSSYNYSVFSPGYYTKQSKRCLSFGLNLSAL